MRYMQIEGTIEQTLYDFARGIDTKDWDLFRRCLSPTCHVSYGEREWDGADAVVAEFAAAHAPLDISMHRIANVNLIEAGELGASTRTYSDAILIRRELAPDDTLHVIGIYSDRLSFDDDRWVIAEREFQAVQYRGNLDLLGSDVAQIEATFGDATRAP